MKNQKQLNQLSSLQCVCRGFFFFLLVYSITLMEPVVDAQDPGGKNWQGRKSNPVKAARSSRFRWQIRNITGESSNQSQRHAIGEGAQSSQHNESSVCILIHLSIKFRQETKQNMSRAPGRLSIESSDRVNVVVRSRIR